MGATEEYAAPAAVACPQLQEKINCSSPSQVSRVRLTHLLSCTNHLYSFRGVSNGWEGRCLAGAAGGGLLIYEYSLQVAILLPSLLLQPWRDGGGKILVMKKN